MTPEVRKIMEDTEHEVDILCAKIYEAARVDGVVKMSVLLRAVGKIMSYHTAFGLYQSHAYRYGAEAVAQYMRFGFPGTEEEFNEATRLEALFGNDIHTKADPADQRSHKSLGKFTITTLIHGAKIGKLGVCYHTFLAAPIIFIKNPDNDKEIVPVAMAIDAVNDGVTEYLKLS